MAIEAKGPFFRSVIRFDLFELDAQNVQLRRNGLPVDLSPQALTTLVMLAARPGELVTRKEIKEALWPGESYGDFDSRLNFVVKKLRASLGDNAEQPRYVQTVRNAGYRFVAPVREAQASPSVVPGPLDYTDREQGDGVPSATKNTLAVQSDLRTNPHALVLFLLITLILTIAAAAALFLQTHRPEAILQGGSIHRPERGPEIASVTPIGPVPRQKIVIRGDGFGLHVPYARTDSPYLAIWDNTAHWSAGRMIPQNSDEVMLDVESWTNTEIVISGFSGDYGLNGWKLNPGDNLQVAVWNPQSAAGPALFDIRVSAP